MLLNRFAPMASASMLLNCVVLSVFAFLYSPPFAFNKSSKERHVSTRNKDTGGSGGRAPLTTRI
jgi:hypothetical protein